MKALCGADIYWGIERGFSLIRESDTLCDTFLRCTGVISPQVPVKRTSSALLTPALLFLGSSPAALQHRPVSALHDTITPAGVASAR